MHLDHDHDETVHTHAHTHADGVTHTHAHTHTHDHENEHTHSRDDCGHTHCDACDQIMLAVSDFEKGNLRLSTVLASMQTPNA